MADLKKIDELKDLCAKRAQKHGLSSESLSAGLEFLALEAIGSDPALVDSIDSDAGSALADYSNWHTGGPSDGGLDGLIYADDLSYVAVIQTKYKKGPVDSSTLEEARSFFFRLAEWQDVDSRNKYNENTQRLLDEAQLDPFKQQIDMYFITSMTAGASDHNEVTDAANNSYLEAGKNVTCRFLTQSEFLELFHNGTAITNTPASVPDVTLNFPEGELFIQESGPKRVLVGVVKGQELANLYNRRDVRNRLFNTNVRAALTTGKVNPKIQETASDDEEAKMFFYYNNGVTATCTDLTVAKNTAHLKNLQVVNGAQTVAALAKALKRKPNPDVKVLIRIIETSESYRNKSKVADLITRYQNTQNPVKASDFFSNDPFQLWISSQFDSLSGKNGFPQIWYEHKRGLRNSQSTAGRKKLTLEQLATLRYACVEDAAFTYRNPKDIWNGENNNANYWTAFGRDGQEISEWNREEIAEVAWMTSTWFSLRESHREMQKIKSNNPERTYLSVLSRFVTALAFNQIKYLQSQDASVPSFSDLVGQPQQHKEMLGMVLKVCRREVMNRLDEEKARQVANPRLNVARDADTWADLKKRVQAKYAFEIENS